MADYTPADIEIGGPIDEEGIKRLIEATQGYGIQLDVYGGRLLNNQSLREEIADCIRDGLPLHLFDDEASYGSFDDLEFICPEIGLSFRKRSDGKYEQDATIAWRTPESEGFCYATQSGTPLVPLDDLIRAAGDGMSAVQAVLDKYTPPEIPPLRKKS